MVCAAISSSESQFFTENLTKNSKIPLAKKLCDLYGDKVLKYRQCRKLLVQIRSRDFSLDEQRFGRCNRHVTVHEIGENLKLPKSTVGLVKKLDIWVSNVLKEIHLTNNMSTLETIYTFGHSPNTKKNSQKAVDASTT